MTKVVVELTEQENEIIQALGVLQSGFDLCIEARDHSNREYMRSTDDKKQKYNELMGIK